MKETTTAAHDSASDLPIRAIAVDDIGQARAILQRMRGAGFTDEELWVVAPQSQEHHFREEVRQAPAGSHDEAAAAVGGGLGALLGGATLAASVAASGGAAIVLAGAIASGAAGGALAGGFMGLMATRGVEPEIADYYSQSLEKGQILVAAQSSDPERLATAEGLMAITRGADPVELPEG